jgi:hypothetical protein
MCAGDHELQQAWNSAAVWRPDDKAMPAPQDPRPERLYKPEVLKTIDDTINGLSEELRALSLDIHGRSTRLLQFKIRKAKNELKMVLCHDQVTLSFNSKNSMLP